MVACIDMLHGMASKQMAPMNCFCLVWHLKQKTVENIPFDISFLFHSNSMFERLDKFLFVFGKMNWLSSRISSRWASSVFCFDCLLEHQDDRNGLSSLALSFSSSATAAESVVKINLTCMAHARNVVSMFK